jgi:hypothetical protein
MSQVRTVTSVLSGRVTSGPAAAYLLALAGSATTALAQDSVALVPGMPGDAVSAYAAGGTTGTTEQQNNYVVDLTLKRSSWGRRYRIGPLAKASLVSNNSVTGQPAFFNHLIASTTVSPLFTQQQALLRSNYSQWSVAGQGVSATRNSLPGSASSAGVLGQQFGSAFLEFGPGPNGNWGDTDDESNVIAAITGVRPRFPDRLYVSRIVAATNRTITSQGNSTLGLGTIDTAGNVHVSADGFNMTLGPDPISNKKTFRVTSQSRLTTSSNQLTESGGTDSAASRIVHQTSTAITTPATVPSVLGTRPVMLNLDLANNLIAETTANVTTTTQGYLPTGASARGSLGLSPLAFGPFNTSGTPVATAAALARNTASTKTRSLAAFGVSATGGVTGRLLVEMPTGPGQLIDRDDNFDPSAVFGSLTNQEFTNYQSQAVFRGANGPVAVTVLPGGDLLLAATVASTGTGADVPQGVNNYIAVARVAAGNTSSVTWTIAAHTGNAQGSAGGLSKLIFGDNGADGVPGTSDAGESDGVVDATAIGEIALNSEVFAGTTTGPSISAPALDSSGNVYFMAGVELKQTPTQTRKAIGLLRANLDRATNAYRLELLATVGDTIAGRNSGRNYQVQFMSVADADSIDSGSVWSSATVQTPLAGLNPANGVYGSPLTLGALVFRAKITYDTNSDQVFLDPNSPSGTGTDEAYNALMVIVPDRPIADIAGPGGNPWPDGEYTADDIIAFISAFTSGEALTADIAGPGQLVGPDGEFTADDIIVFINAFSSGG